MFTRRADARTSGSMPGGMPQAMVTEMQLQEARAAAVPLHMTNTLSSGPPPISVNAPPPIPGDAEEQDPADNLSVIGEDLTIEGQSITIRCRGALEVNGKIQAEVHSQKLVVGRAGQVEGTVAADSVDVWGRVSGTIMGSRVVLHPSAEVEGDIHARTLSVADGASFEGRSRKVTDPAAVAPRLEPGAPAHTGEAVPVPRAIPAELSS